MGRGDLPIDRETDPWPLITEIESKDAFHQRDRIWSEHANGWHGRLLLMVTELTEEHFMGLGPPAFFDTHDRQMAALRMVALELLANSMWMETGQWPKLTEELRSYAQLPRAAVVDPSDPTGESLRMKPVDGRVEFYSVGRNGVDDGGIAPTEDEDGEISGGDLRLAEVFAPLLE